MESNPSSLLDAFCKALEIKTTLKREQRVGTRLAKMGHGVTCERCGGGGHYSYNGTHSLCFGCGGSGVLAPTLTSALLALVQEEAATGKVAAYLADLRTRQRLAREGAGAVDRVMAAWTDSGVSQLYDWMQSANGVEPHKSISAINAEMHAQYQLVTTAWAELQSIAARQTTTAEELAVKKLAVAAKQFALVELSRQAVLKIAESATKLAPYRPKT